METTTAQWPRCDKCGRDTKGAFYSIGNFTLCILCYQLLESSPRIAGINAGQAQMAANFNAQLSLEDSNPALESAVLELCENAATWARWNQAFEGRYSMQGLDHFLCLAKHAAAEARMKDAARALLAALESQEGE